MNKKISRTILIPYLLLMCIAIVTSCSNDEENWMQESADNILKIETHIVQTRAVVTGTDFQQGDKIGIFAVYTKGGISIGGGAIETPDNSVNIAAQYNGTAWTFDDNIRLHNQSADIYAYFPYKTETKSTIASARNIPEINIDITPDKANGQTDYMYGVSEKAVNVTTPTANILFKHALARITLSILKSPNDIGKGNISKVCLRNNTNVQTISTKGIMKMTGGITRNDNIDATITLKTNVTINNEEAQNIDLLVFPATGKRGTELTIGNIIESVEIVLTIDGSDYKIPLSGMIWEAGKQYTYPITVNRKTAITPTAIPGERIYMGFNGDNGKPLYWSSHNLGAKSSEEYGGLYGWADPTGEKTSTDLNDYPSTNPPTDISGTEYDIARRMWGDNWRIPSNGEMWSLLANSTEEWTTLNGVQGVKYTSKKNGNTIFFPVAPIRKGDVVQYESSTYYWLDQLNEDDHTLAGTFYIYKGNNLLDYPTAGKQRYMGLPIRPVTE